MVQRRSEKEGWNEHVRRLGQVSYTKGRRRGDAKKRNCHVETNSDSDFLVRAHIKRNPASDYSCVPILHSPTLKSHL